MLDQGISRRALLLGSAAASAGKLARRAFSNLIYFNTADRGGHFAAWEHPQLFAREMRAAFRSLR